MRAATPRGAHVGAYGWVEDLRPDARPPARRRTCRRRSTTTRRTPIHRDRESQGFVHAPSLNHAVTAAILRSGYLSAARARPTSRTGWRSTSRRGARAWRSRLIDGVRAGNDLGALLGYRLERFLHDYARDRGRRPSTR